jgi:acetyltransferase-like isoleucine patch superfamily enzyme
MRNVWYRLLGADLRGYVWLRRVSIPRNWPDVSLEAGVALDDGVVLLCSGEPRRERILIRAGAYINRYTILDAHQRIEIGRNCMIGPHCFITDGDHGMAGTEPINQQPMRIAPVLIEDEAWLGAGVIVLKGVKVGRGAVIGAGSIVTKSVEPYAIAMGSPARVVGRRQDLEIKKEKCAQ